MATGKEKVRAAVVVTEQARAAIRSAARRMERLESDLMANAEGVLMDPLDIASYCETVSQDLTNAARTIRAASWPQEDDYYNDDIADIATDIPA
jgi:hypothetical protein